MIIDIKTIIRQQFLASIEMLKSAIVACPEDVWGDRQGSHEFWYITYHTIFFLDYYMSESSDRFSPPAPFTLSELDPSGLMPDRVYSKEELLIYLEHGRIKSKARIDGFC